MRSYGKEVPIFTMTAHYGSKEVRACVSAGSTSYLAKPIRKATLFEALGEYTNIVKP